jgi:DNA-binding MarR family transcriptional regulator
MLRRSLLRANERIEVLEATIREPEVRISPSIPLISAQDTSKVANSRSALTLLEKAILTNLSDGRSAEDIQKRTGVAPAIISQKIDLLHSQGFVTEGRHLTEKGFELLATRPEP